MKNITHKHIILAIIFTSSTILALTEIARYGRPEETAATIACAEALIQADGLREETVIEFFNEDFEKRELEFRKKIVATTGIDSKIWDEGVDHYAQEFNEYAQKTELGTRDPLSKETEERVRDILENIGVAFDGVYLVKDNAKRSAAAASSNALFITEELFNALSAETQAFIIAHEYAHILHADAAREAALGVLLSDKNEKTLPQYEQLLADYSSFHEERADVHSLLKGKSFRDGAVEFFNEQIQLYGDKVTPTHPKNAVRIAMAQAVDAVYNKVV